MYIHITYFPRNKKSDSYYHFLPYLLSFEVKVQGERNFTYFPVKYNTISKTLNKLTTILVKSLRMIHLSQLYYNHIYISKGRFSLSKEIDENNKSCIPFSRCATAGSVTIWTTGRKAEEEVLVTKSEGNVIIVIYQIVQHFFNQLY